MQKKLIALAVAGLASTGAFAQSNVTIYGVADMYYANARASGAKGVNAINSGGLSGSRIGFKGVEDLGNGLKAIFTIEHALALDSDVAYATSNSSRQAFVGVTGGFGTVVAGRLQTAGYDFACTTNPLGGSALDALGKLGVSTLLTCGNGGRANNAVAYVSPNFSGFTAAVNHARLAEDQHLSGAATNNSYANLLTGTYANGPIGVNLTYSKIQAEGAPLAITNDITEWGIGGSYDFKVAKLFASYQTAETNATGTAGETNNKWLIAGAIPVGAAGAVVLQYADNKIKSTAAKDDAKSYTVAYTHSLSKRTTAYAGYNRVSNDGVGVFASTLAPTAGGNSSTLALGVRHSF